MEKDPARRRQRIQNAASELKLAARALPSVAAVASRPQTRTAVTDTHRSEIVEPVRRLARRQPFILNLRLEWSNSSVIIVVTNSTEKLKAKS